MMETHDDPKSSESTPFFCTILVVYLGLAIFHPGYMWQLVALFSKSVFGRNMP